MNQNLNFQIYENGNGTKGVFATFDEAVLGAKLYLDGESRIEIQTVNSMSPIRTWFFDYEVQQWVEQL